MNVSIIRSKEDTATALTLLKDKPALACDTETTGLKAGVARLLSVQISDGENHVLIPTSEGVSVEPFTELFADKSVTKIFHNARFDLPFLEQAGILVRNVFDTMLAEKVITRGGDQSVSLAETLYRYFAVDLDKSQRKKFGSGWSGVWSEEMVEYAMKDVAYLPELMRRQVEWLEKLGETERYEEAINKWIVER